MEKIPESSKKQDLNWLCAGDYIRLEFILFLLIILFITIYIAFVLY